MKKTISLLSVALAALILVSSIYAADPQGQGPRKTATERVTGLTSKLALTPEQQEKIKAIYEKHDPKINEIRAKGSDKSLNEADLAKLHELKKSETDEVETVLTADQKAKLNGERGAKPTGKKGKTPKAGEAATESPVPEAK